MCVRTYVPTENCYVLVMQGPCYACDDNRSASAQNARRQNRSKCTLCSNDPSWLGANGGLRALLSASTHSTHSSTHGKHKTSPLSMALMLRAMVTSTENDIFFGSFGYLQPFGSNPSSESTTFSSTMLCADVGPQHRSRAQKGGRFSRQVVRLFLVIESKGE